MTRCRYPAHSSISDFISFTTPANSASAAPGPYFYLPKLESHLEARLWADVIIAGRRRLCLAPGTVKVTVLIETILAAFEMDEILHELRDNIVGLNCGRWDYIFSFIKKFSSVRISSCRIDSK